MTEYEVLTVENQGGALYLRRRSTAGIMPESASPVNGTAEAGSIASFSDGAADRKLKELVVSIEPLQAGTGDPSPNNIRAINGWKGAKIRRTGRNLWGGDAVLEDVKASISRATVDDEARTVRFLYTYGNSGPICGANPATGTRRGLQFKENTQYTFITALSKDIGTATNLRVYYSADASIYDSLPYVGETGVKETVVLNSRSGRDVMRLTKTTNEGTTTLYADECGIFEGVLTAEDFEPYKGYEISEDWESVAGTVYGGTLNVLTGELTVDRAMVEFGADTSRMIWGTSSVGIPYVHIEPVLVPMNLSINGLISDQYATASATIADKAVRLTNNVVIYDSDRFPDRDTAFASLAENPVHVVYPLRAPVVYHLTPAEITTLAGENNVYADCGPVESLVYVRDTGAAIEAMGAEVSGMLAEDAPGGVASRNYAVGEFLTADGKLYRTTAAIAVGETVTPGTNVSETTVGEDLTELNSFKNEAESDISQNTEDVSGLKSTNAYPVDTNKVGRTVSGVTFDYDEDNDCWEVTGTASQTSSAFINLITSVNSIPFDRSKDYYIHVEQIGDYNVNVGVRVNWYYNGSPVTGNFIYSGTQKIEIPETATGVVIRIQVGIPNVTLNEKIRVTISENESDRSVSSRIDETKFLTTELSVFSLDNVYRARYTDIGITAGYPQGLCYANGNFYVIGNDGDDDGEDYLLKSPTLDGFDNAQKVTFYNGGHCGDICYYDGKLYIATGENRVAVYDEETMAQQPDIETAFNVTSIAYYDGYFYIRHENNIEKCKLENGEFTEINRIATSFYGNWSEYGTDIVGQGILVANDTIYSVSMITTHFGFRSPWLTMIDMKTHAVKHALLQSIMEEPQNICVIGNTFYMMAIRNRFISFYSMIEGGEQVHNRCYLYPSNKALLKMLALGSWVVNSSVGRTIPDKPNYIADKFMLENEWFCTSIIQKITQINNNVIEAYSRVVDKDFVTDWQKLY